jgi:hypothetical protein
MAYKKGAIISMRKDFDYRNRVGPGRSHGDCAITSPSSKGAGGDGELPLFGEKNPLHPALLHEGGGETRMILQRKAHSAIALRRRSSEEFVYRPEEGPLDAKF